MEGALIMFELIQSIFHAKAQRRKDAKKRATPIRRSTFLRFPLRLCAFA
jgi:hypothetical protein